MGTTSLHHHEGLDIYVEDVGLNVLHLTRNEEYCQKRDILL